MRYLIENNNYTILYLPEPLPKFSTNVNYYIHAELLDKKTDIIYCDREDYFGNLEKCLMKLGRRLQKKWRNRKK